MKKLLTLLKNERSFFNWARASYCIDSHVLKIPLQDAIPRGYRSRESLLGFRKEWIKQYGPKQYPCYVFPHVVDMRYEEKQPRFLYVDDLKQLLAGATS